MTKRIKLDHAMIDLETMSTNTESAIVSIGVVLFNPIHGKLDNKNTFYRELDWSTQGREMNQDTFDWWMKKTDKEQEALSGIDDLPDVLHELVDFLPKGVKVWGNGSVFDISILTHAYGQFNIQLPWEFWNVRDCRTILDVFEASRGGTGRTVNIGQSHNALQDALSQTKYICKAYKVLLG